MASEGCFEASGQVIKLSLSGARAGDTETLWRALVCPQDTLITTPPPRVCVCERARARVCVTDGHFSECGSQAQRGLNLEK